VDDVAKEVGLTYYLLSNVIVMLTRGVIGEDARRYANDAMRKTSLAIVLRDGADVAEIVARPLVVLDVLEREAAYALELKPLDVPVTTTATSRPKHCANCGGPIAYDDKFCPHCGVPVQQNGLQSSLEEGAPGTPSLF
jgi:hypothetical protein